MSAKYHQEASMSSFWSTSINANLPHYSRQAQFTKALTGQA